MVPDEYPAYAIYPLNISENIPLRENCANKECPVNAGLSQDYILGPTLLILYINELPDIICNVAIYLDDTTVYSK